MEQMDKSHRQEMFKASSQAAVDCGTKAVNALFLLNGAAATALLAQNDNAFLRYTAIVFSLAALWSIAALGLSHIFNLIISETWRNDTPQNPDEPWITLSIPPDSIFFRFLKKESLSQNDITLLRLKLLIFSCGPGVLFLVGLVFAALAI
jgi:hypothetical protein